MVQLCEQRCGKVFVSNLMMMSLLRRTTRAAARFETGSAADDGEMTWRGGRGRSAGAGAAAAEESSLLHNGSDSVASGAGQHGSPLARPR